MWIYPNGLKSKKSPEVLVIKIGILEINEKGEIGKGKYTTWSYTLTYTAEELAEHPFKISQIKKLVYLVNEKILVSLFYQTYTDCKKRLEKKKKELGIK